MWSPKAAVHTQLAVTALFLSICRLTPLQSIDIKSEKQPVKKVILSSLENHVDTISESNRVC